MGAADRFAAQMKTPGGEGITEGLAHDQRAQSGGRQRRRRDVKIARDLERQHGHADGGTQHAGAESRHARDRRQTGGEVEGRVERRRLRIETPEQAADQQRGEEKSAAKARAERDRRGQSLQHNEPGQHAQRHRLHQVELERAMPGAEHLWRDEAEAADDQPAERRPQHNGGSTVAEDALRQGDALHQQDAAEGADHTKDEHMAEEGAGRRIEIREDGQGAMPMHDHARDKAGNDRAGDHGHQRGHRIGAQHNLERIKRARQRRTERRRNGTGRATGDKQAHVGAPGGQPSAQDRRQCAADLRIGRLQPDRGATGIGDECLQRNIKRAADAQPPAMQGVCLDGVGHPALEARARQPDNGRQQEAAPDGEDQRAPELDADSRGQALVDRQGEQDLMQKLRRIGDQRHQRPREDADHQRAESEAGFTRANEGSQPEGEETFESPGG